MKTMNNKIVMDTLEQLNMREHRNFFESIFVNS